MSKKGKTYIVQAGDSKYLREKYGDVFTAKVEDTDINVLGQSWRNMAGNPACMLFFMRGKSRMTPLGEAVYYCKVDGLGELFYDSELIEEITK
jgi:hypothetical protein